MDVVIEQSEANGEVFAPPSKSHTIRAVIFAALANGKSIIKSPLVSADSLSAVRAVQAFGAKVDFDLNAPLQKKSAWQISGGKNFLCVPQQIVDVGNSGSTLYFLSPIASTFFGRTNFDGDESIRTRPADFLVDALNQIDGVKAECFGLAGKSCPLFVDGTYRSEKKSRTIKTEGALSQYVSGIMMAATRLSGKTEILLENPKETPYLAMTQKWLESFGVNVERSADFKRICVFGPHEILPFERTIPSDWSACAFLLLAGFASNGEVSILNADDSETQGDAVIVENFQKLGAKIEWQKNKKIVKTLKSQKIESPNKEQKSEREVHLNLSSCPDSLCATACAACFFDGIVFLEDLAICRGKECDRVKVMKQELQKLGALVEEKNDSLIIRGKVGAKNLHGGEIQTFGDHRIAMAFSALATGIKEPVTIKNANCAGISFPNFFETLQTLKIKMQKL